MKNRVKGQAQVAPSAPNLSALRCAVLAVLIGNPLFSKAEQLRANHHAHECECPKRLALWLCNVQREAERRELAAKALTRATKQLSYCSLDTLTNELYQLLECPSLTRSEKQSIIRISPPDSKLEALTLVGRFYVKALNRNSMLTEN